MEEKLVIVLNEMADYLNVCQMKKLQEVLIRAFADREPDQKQIDNGDYLRLFLDAKRIEGCSIRTVQYYKVTIERLLRETTTPVRRLTTEEIRKYLVDYQEKVVAVRSRWIIYDEICPAFSLGWKKRIIF